MEQDEELIDHEAHQEPSLQSEGTNCGVDFQ